MIIKRWNGAWVKEFPQTKAQLIRNDSDSAFIFDSNDKLLPTYLPDSVFDTLTYYGTTTGDVASSGSRLILANALEDMRVAAAAASRSVKGYYFVITATGTITGLTGIAAYPAGVNKFYTLQFRPQDGGTSGTANTSSGVLEAGDWFVIEDISGDGGSGTPYVITASVVNNSFELATTTIDGIVRLSDATTYASLTGNHAITEGVLKTVIDNAAFVTQSHAHGNITSAGAIGSTADLVVVTGASGVLTTQSRSGIDSRASFPAASHSHGDIANGGTITSTQVLPASGDTILISDSSASGAIKRGVAFGTSTSTFLTNDGTWSTPQDTTYNIATSSVAGIVEVFSDTDQTEAAQAVTATAGRTYGIQLNAANQMVVNVPWTDNNTTYSAGEGITLSSTTFRMTYPLYVQTTTPTTSVTGTIWYDIN